MWGRVHTTETRQKMSKSRTGKVGSAATAWKGGKLSFNNRVKSAVQRRWKWFTRVIDRDKQCTNCGAISQLDAHHIHPFSKLVKQVLLQYDVLWSDDEKYEYVCTHPLIKDEELANGKTLCRSCHKTEHQNWGSHNAST